MICKLLSSKNNGHKRPFFTLEKKMTYIFFFTYKFKEEQRMSHIKQIIQLDHFRNEDIWDKDRTIKWIKSALDRIIYFLLITWWMHWFVILMKKKVSTTFWITMVSKHHLKSHVLRTKLNKKLKKLQGRAKRTYISIHVIWLVKTQSSQ